MKSHLRKVFSTAEFHTIPFRYWFLRDVLPAGEAAQVCRLPFVPPELGDTHGRRETNNASRTFFSQEQATQHPVIQSISGAFQDRAIVEAIENCFELALTGSYLRIECCQDTDGFWLEPHTDIAAKLLTMVVYLSTGPEAEAWGTDLYDAKLRPAGRAPSEFNKGLVFIPANDTWHGFAKRPIHGVRKSLIINYVREDWRSRHELCFPDRPCLG